MELELVALKEGPAARPPSISARIAAAKEEVNKTWGSCILSWFVPIAITADVGVLFWCAVASWPTTPLWLVVVLLVLASVEACQVGLLRVWRSPARVLCDSRGSFFGLHTEQPGSCWPATVKVGLAMASLGIWVILFTSDMQELVATNVKCNSKADAKCNRTDLPSYMPCDYIDVDSYMHCVHSMPWWWRGRCNDRSTMCYLTLTGQMAIVVALMLGPLMLFALHVVLKCCIRIKPTDEKAVQNIQERAREIDAAVAAGSPGPDGPLIIMVDFVMFVLDWLVLDFLSIYNFYKTDNIYFGRIAMTLYVKTLDEFFTAGGPGEAFKQCAKSLREGRKTDKFHHLMHSDRATEAVVVGICVSYCIAVCPRISGLFRFVVFR